MEKNDIIQHVQDLTEHKADNRIDFQTALELRIAKYVKEKKFWWRRRIYKFSTNANEALIDLKSQQVPIQDVTAIRKMYRIDGPKELVYIPPFWDIESQMDEQENTDTGIPTRYTVEPGSPRTIRLSLIPNDTYYFKFAYLSSYIPDPSKTDFSDIVPADLHFAIVDGLEMDVMRFLYGPNSEKFAAAQANYLDSVQKTFDETDFTTERGDQFIIDDGSPVRSSSNNVQSTGSGSGW